MRGYLLPLPAGDAGTYATLQHMRLLAREASLTPIVRQSTAELVIGEPGRVQPLILAHWIGDHTTFLADPALAETLQDPAWIMGQILTRGVAQLDCDDVAMLAAAMGLSVGLKARFVVVAFASPNAPFRHVWAELADSVRPAWVAIDPTRPAQGFDALPITRRAVVEV